MNKFIELILIYSIVWVSFKCIKNIFFTYNHYPGINNKQPLDLVYLWCGKGPKRLEKLNQIKKYYSKNNILTNTMKSRDSSSFDDDELKYSLRSVDKYVNFFNNIFIVVDRDDELPKWLDTKSVNIIYHDEILPKGIKLYNSNTIENFIWRIPDLGKNFVYMNDDLFFINDTSKSSFISPDGKLIKYVESKKNNCDINIDKQYCLWLNSIITEFGIKYYTQHFAQVYNKQKVTDFFHKIYNETPDKSRFINPLRTLSDINILRFEDNNSVINNECIYTRKPIGLYREGSNNNLSLANIKQLLYDKNYKMLCINNIEKNELTNEIEQLFEDKYNFKSKFEI